MKQWLKDLWEGFYTVLVGMKITWRHLFVHKVTLHYPEEKWQLPPKSRMRLFMKYEDCIGCGQCARACPVQCIYIKADKRDPKAAPIFAANGTAHQARRRTSSTSTCRCAATATCARTRAPPTAST